MSSNYSWKISEPVRLDKFLQNTLPLEISKDISNSKIRRLIMAGSITINNQQCRNPAFNLRKGNTVRAQIDIEKLFFEKQPDDIDYILTQKDVLYEDDVIIVVNKPAFLPTEDTIVESRQSMHSAVVKYLWEKNPSLKNPPYAGIMHRLDRETSGVLLFTKSRSVNNEVHRMFEEHTAQKVYRAVCSEKSPAAVEKNIKNNSFTVENFIGRISAKSARCKIGPLSESKGGQYAKTEFYITSRKNELLYIDCHLFTGRTHQIRVHLSLKNIPIIGDDLYGGARGIKELNERIMLHAVSLTFPHPVTQKKMTVTAPLPPHFE